MSCSTCTVHFPVALCRALACPLSLSQHALVVMDPLLLRVLYCTVLYCTVLYCTVLYCTVLVAFFRASIWLRVCLAAQQISTAFCKSNLASQSNRLRTASSLIPTTILSLISSLHRAPNSQFFACSLSSVTCASMVSFTLCIRVLNTCLSYVIFLFGLQYSSNISESEKLDRLALFFLRT